MTVSLLKNNDTKSVPEEIEMIDELECKQNKHSKKIEIIVSPQKNNDTAVHELKCKQKKWSKKVDVKVALQKNNDTVVALKKISKK